MSIESTLHGSEETLDLPVELPDPHLALDMFDPLSFTSFFESSPKLRAVVADEKSMNCV